MIHLSIARRPRIGSSDDWTCIICDRASGLQIATTTSADPTRALRWAIRLYESEEVSVCDPECPDFILEPRGISRKQDIKDLIYLMKHHGRWTG